MAFCPERGVIIVSNALIEQSRQNLHEIIDDIELVEDQETVDEYRDRVDELMDDLTEAFE